MREGKNGGRCALRSKECRLARLLGGSEEGRNKGDGPVGIGGRGSMGSLICRGNNGAAGKTRSNGICVTGLSSLQIHVEREC